MVGVWYTTLDTNSGYAEWQLTDEPPFTLEFHENLIEEIKKRQPEVTNFNLRVALPSGKMRIYYSLPKFKVIKRGMVSYRVDFPTGNVTPEKVAEVAQWVTENYPDSYNHRVTWAVEPSVAIVFEFTWVGESKNGN